jgi:hypothetical protein
VVYASAGRLQARDQIAASCIWRSVSGGCSGSAPWSYQNRSGLPSLQRNPRNHILADSRIGIRTASVRQIPATDHRAVYAVLTLPHEQSD